MGELLRFPDRSDRTGEVGAEHRSAPARRPSASHPAGQQTLDDIERIAGPEARRRAEQSAPAARPAAADETGWAVPGVEGRRHEPVAEAAPAEPTRASRRAQNVAIAALTRHDASEGEIRAKLVAKGLDEADVQGELDRLRGVGLIDDAAFATRLVERLRERKGLGDQAIRSTLRGRLVPQDVVDAVLAEQAEDDETRSTRLDEVAYDRARRLTSLEHSVAERRLTAYLMRKGYSGSDVRYAVHQALDAAGIR
jgi:regulatory protein